MAYASFPVVERGLFWFDPLREHAIIMVAVLEKNQYAMVS